MAINKTRSVLIYSDTARSADALYFGGVDVPDAFVALGVRGKKYAVVSALEFGRVKRHSKFDAVLPLEALTEEARKAWPRQKPGPARIIALLVRRLKAGALTVPGDFSAGLYQELRDIGVRVSVADGMLFPQREVKTAAEAAALIEGNRCSAAGIGAAERVLAASKVKGGKLLYQRSVLTSERLKVAVETACIEAGSVSQSTIVAGGDQACDPHNRGSGPLRANELIIVDVFPCVSATGFYGDMTRTFLRGRANDAQKAIVAAVRKAQLKALGTIRAGVEASEVHRQVSATFVALGFETKATPDGSIGFFHGTGHGLGMEVHEPPRMNATSHFPLKKGTVVTVEPGLYYPGVGACRIEDVVQVTAGAPRMLSKYPYRWELR
jgi:Xaa-Pro aminopeptidase